MSERVSLAEIVGRQLPKEPFTWRGFFERTHAGREPMKPLGKACHDCAVTCGLYTEYSDELAKLPVDFQDRVAERWFCHNHPNRACRGNIDRLAEYRLEFSDAPPL